MATRPTVTQVRAIINTTRADAQVEMYIDGAIIMVETPLAGSSYSNARKLEIHRWIAAHLIASTSEEGVLASDSLGAASQSYARAELEMFLKGTTYGQQALMFDEDSLLAGLGRARASIQAFTHGDC